MAGVIAAGATGGGGLMVIVAAALAVVFFVDDVVGLPVVARLGAQLAAACAALALETGISSPLLFVVLAAAIAWMANLYNFMDGTDGLAGGMTVIGFGALALAAHLAGQGPLAGLCGAIAAGAAAFLLFNFHPARIFMGDVGSVPLGFLAGALGVAGWQSGAWPLWLPVVVFAPFECDATLTLIQRLARGERAWRAHRDHYYQRLARMGFGHRGVAWIEYGVMAACAAVALAVREASGLMQLLAIAALTAALSAIAVVIDLRWARHLRAVREIGL